MSIARAARRLILRSLCLAAVIALGACAGRPGVDTLQPVARVAGVKLVTIYVATTRTAEANSPTIFDQGRARGVNYARYVISIPPGHKPAAIEWPKGTPDPRTSFAVVSSERLTEQQFAAEATASAARSIRPRRDVGIFVHGYNYTFQESLFRLAQMDADSGAGGGSVLFAWPSQGALAAYVADKESVTYSRDGLAHVIEVLGAAPRSGGVTLFAHSMGGWLTVEAIRQLKLEGRQLALRRLNEVVLAAPDIDVDVFRKQLEVVGRLDPPVTLLVSKDDKALTLSKFLSGDRGRVGAVDVSDPHIQEVVREEGLRVIDISELQSENGSNHDRYVALAAIYPALQAQLGQRSGNGVEQAGAFVLDATAATLTSPLRVVGAVLQPR